MFLRQRFETEELKLFRLLNKRIQLSRKDLNYYLNLEKGFEGELKFDERLKSLTSDHLILSDLLFEINNSFFQIDALLIISKTIYLFDIKNFEGDYYLDSGSWYTLSKSEIKDPLAQLKRSETLLRRMIQDLKLNFSIEAYLVFVNTDFYLYQAPLNLPIIFPSQIDRFMKKINLSESKLSERHLKFAEKLLSHHIEKSPFTRVPVYTYDELNVDVICSMCNSFNVGVVENILICNKCGCIEDITKAVLRNVQEFHILFPDRKITTNAIYDWCKVIKSKKTIRRVLNKNYKLIGHGKYSYYVPFDLN